ncbi:hypothetical protein D3C76_1498080 [compost metagenome]
MQQSSESNANACENDALKESKVKESKVNKSNKDISPYSPPEGKIKFAEMVYLSQEESERLIKDFGESEFKYWVQQLSDYHVENSNRPSKIKKDHNLAIRNWIRRDQRSRDMKNNKRPRKSGLTEQELRELENEI